MSHAQAPRLDALIGARGGGKRKRGPEQETLPACPAVDNLGPAAPAKRPRPLTTSAGPMHREERALVALLAELMGPPVPGTAHFARTMMRMTPPSTIVRLLSYAGQLRGGNAVLNAQEGTALRATLSAWGNHTMLGESLLLGPEVRLQVAVMPPGAVAVLDDMPLADFLWFYEKLMQVEDRRGVLEGNKGEWFAVWKLLMTPWYENGTQGVPPVDVLALDPSGGGEEALKRVYTGMRSFVQDHIVFRTTAPLHLYQALGAADYAALENYTIGNSKMTLQRSLFVTATLIAPNAPAAAFHAMLDALHATLFRRHQAIMLYVHLYHARAGFMDTIPRRFAQGLSQAFGSVLARFMAPDAMVAWLDDNAVDLYRPNKKDDNRMWAALAPPYYRRDGGQRTSTFKLAIAVHSRPNVGFLATLMASVYSPAGFDLSALAAMNMPAAPAAITRGILAHTRESIDFSKNSMTPLAKARKAAKQTLNAEGTRADEKAALRARLEEECAAVTSRADALMANQAADRLRRTAWLRAFHSTRVALNLTQTVQGFNARVTADQFWRTFGVEHGREDGADATPLPTLFSDSDEERSSSSSSSSSSFDMDTPRTPGRDLLDMLDNGDTFADTPDFMPFSPRLESDDERYLDMDPPLTPGRDLLDMLDDSQDAPSSPSPAPSPSFLPSPSLARAPPRGLANITSLAQLRHLYAGGSLSRDVIQQWYDGHAVYRSAFTRLDARDPMRWSVPASSETTEILRSRLARLRETSGSSAFMYWYNLATGDFFAELQGESAYRVVAPPSPDHLRLYPFPRSSPPGPGSSPV